MLPADLRRKNFSYLLSSLQNVNINSLLQQFPMIILRSSFTCQDLFPFIFKQAQLCMQHCFLQPTLFVSLGKVLHRFLIAVHLTDFLNSQLIVYRFSPLAVYQYYSGMVLFANLASRQKLINICGKPRPPDNMNVVTCIFAMRHPHAVCSRRWHFKIILLRLMQLKRFIFTYICLISYIQKSRQYRLYVKTFEGENFMRQGCGCQCILNRDIHSYQVKSTGGI